MLPHQASFAGSTPGRTSNHCGLSSDCLSRIPNELLDAFSLERPGTCNSRKLYAHQAKAIDSAMKRHHTLVCTGTGSGKSLCFLLPVLAPAAVDDATSLLMFPTKALAQDQLSKLISLLSEFPTTLSKTIRPGIIDGDVAHSDRQRVASNCNLILTNPDTLHAAILPGWKTSTYKGLFASIRYVVIDEAHMYEGVFGAHVAMVLSRLMRVCAVRNPSAHLPTFLACSATMSYPEQHFRLLCPISSDSKVTILSPEDDGSPRAAKHFFVWNPPIMDVNGISTGRVTVPRPKKAQGSDTDVPNSTNNGVGQIERSRKARHATAYNATNASTNESSSSHVPSTTSGERKYFAESDGIVLADDNHTTGRGTTAHYTEYTEPGRWAKQKGRKRIVSNGMQLYRRHAADETALLLARAVAKGVRCIAFCKTRCLVEWVYDRTVRNLQADPSTKHLAARVESYRGGYTREARRKIETKLFQNELLGVVGTSALELGVDIGGIDVTLHCGYPTSFASLLQQAGRAGRGKVRLNVPSLAIMVCFNSPAEQHLWRHPTHLLSKRLTASVSMPVNVGLVQGHLLCAGAEYPLTGEHRVTILGASAHDGDDAVIDINKDKQSSTMVRTDVSTETTRVPMVLNDFDLFGSEQVFLESLQVLQSTGMMKEVPTPVAVNGLNHILVHKTHPVSDKDSFCRPVHSSASSTDTVSIIVTDFGSTTVSVRRQAMGEGEPPFDRTSEL